ncbi:glycosyltransferase family 4 protein [Psychroserpens mesophilus]|uniref:glycosyltransferase family 4 protein n=1 Tax=Psychroserpens mesophilus TaxID=325473 RepID=UPI003D65A133
MSEIKTKVLFIGPLPPPYSGPELSTKQLLESDLKSHFDIIFLNTNVRKDNSKKGKIDMSALLSVITFNLKLFKRLLFKRPDIAYHLVTPTEIGWLGRDIWFVFQCKIFGVKKIIHFRGSHLDINYKTFRPFSRKLIKYACGLVDAAIVQSDCLKGQFKGLVSEDKVHVIPNTVDNLFKSLDRSHLSNTPQILFFGHLTKAKGYTDIVKVIPQVASKFPEVKFLFCGNIRRGEPGVRYNQITKERILYEDPFEVEAEILNSEYKNNYQNLGIVSGEDKLDLIRQSWLFLLPSYSEGFSRSVLESMAAGLPIVTTPVGANKDVIKNDYNGVLINPGDLKSMELNLIRLLGNQQLRDTLSHNGKVTFENEFEETKVVDRYVNLFNTLMK